MATDDAAGAVSALAVRTGMHPSYAQGQFLKAIASLGPFARGDLDLSRTNLLHLIESAGEVNKLEKYNFMASKLGPTTPKTAQPSDEEWTELYKQYTVGR